jgi:hypothetical protein
MLVAWHADLLLCGDVTCTLLSGEGSPCALNITGLVVVAGKEVAAYCAQHMVRSSGWLPQLNEHRSTMYMLRCMA